MRRTLIVLDRLNLTWPWRLLAALYGALVTSLLVKPRPVPTCPKWNDGRHNEIQLRGTVLFWRRYFVCCSCGNVRHG